jgi:hypothetical protein
MNNFLSFTCFCASKKKTSGSAIGITMLTIAALLTISLGMARIVPRDFKETLDMEASLNAEMTAWSGIEHGLLLVRNARKENKFYELSSSYPNSGSASNRPFGRYVASASNCLLDRTVCPALDRMLGFPVNQTPVSFGSATTESPTLKSFDSYYSLVIWHRRQDVGNRSDIYDAINDATLKSSRTSAIINPILERDEVRRLDIRDVNGINIIWQPIESSNCKTQDADSRFWLIGTLLDENNNILARKLNDTQPYRLDMNGQQGAVVLSLRFLVTTIPGKEANISDCFMRYTLVSQSGETHDLGFDVVEATGRSAGIQRKLRVQVDRENGRPLNIFDFGLACQFCEGIN